jgi:hypothetical protein
MAWLSAFTAFEATERRCVVVNSVRASFHFFNPKNSWLEAKEIHTNSRYNPLAA